MFFITPPPPQKNSKQTSPLIMAALRKLSSSKHTRKTLAVGEGSSYLNQQWVSKTQSTLQVLPKGIIQEAGSCDLAVFVLIHDELCGLA